MLFGVNPAWASEGVDVTGNAVRVFPIYGGVQYDYTDSAMSIIFGSGVGGADGASSSGGNSNEVSSADSGAGGSGSGKWPVGTGLGVDIANGRRLVAEQARQKALTAALTVRKSRNIERKKAMEKALNKRLGKQEALAKDISLKLPGNPGMSFDGGAGDDGERLLGGEQAFKWLQDNDLGFGTFDKKLGSEIAGSKGSTVDDIWLYGSDLKDYYENVEKPLLNEIARRQKGITDNFRESIWDAVKSSGNEQAIGALDDAIAGATDGTGQELLRPTGAGYDCALYPGRCDKREVVLKSRSKADQLGELDLFNQIKDGVELLDKAKPTTPQGKKAKSAGYDLYEAADDSLISGDVSEASDYLSFAKQVASVALGWDPVTGVGISAYEALFGEDIFTGESLSSTERTLAIIGMVTGGLANKLNKMNKVKRALNSFVKFMKAKGSNLKNVFSRAENVLDSAGVSGAKFIRGIPGLKFTGAGTWVSEAGLVYGKGSRHKNRLRHILKHTVENPNKAKHSVFKMKVKEVPAVIDEAWRRRGPGVLQNNGNKLYEIPMGKVVGTKGENAMTILIKGRTE